MTIKEISERIIELYETVDLKEQDMILPLQLVNELRFKIKGENFSNDSLLPILETTKKVCSTKKRMKQILEKELLSLIAYLPHELWMGDVDKPNQRFQRNIETNEGQIAESLIDFAKKIHGIKLDRDAFSGKRRGYSIHILGSLSDYFEVPEFMELCSKSIRSKSKNEFLDSIECLKDYCKERDETPSEELVRVIDRRIEKTKHKSEAVGGLNLLVVTDLISEFEALSRLDEWKERKK